MYIIIVKIYVPNGKLKCIKLCKLQDLFYLSIVIDSLWGRSTYIRTYILMLLTNSDM